MKGNRTVLSSRELPYQVNKAALIERMAETRPRGKALRIPIVMSPDRTGLSIGYRDLKRGAQRKKVLNSTLQIYRAPINLSINIAALLDGEARPAAAETALWTAYIEHRRRSSPAARVRFGQSPQRAHILEGLRIALGSMECDYSNHRQSKTPETRPANN